MNINDITNIKGLDNHILSYCDPVSVAKFSKTSHFNHRIAKEYIVSKSVITEKIQTLEKIHFDIEAKCAERLDETHTKKTKRFIKLGCLVTAVTLFTVLGLIFIPVTFKLSVILLLIMYPPTGAFASAVLLPLATSAFYEKRRLKLQKEATTQMEKIQRLTEEFLVHFILPGGLSPQELIALSDRHRHIVKESQKYLNKNVYFGSDPYRIRFFR